MPGGGDLLSPHLLRSLGQKEYEKRKGAALEIEQAIKELRDAGQHERVRDVVHYVAHDLAASPHPNVRKGALHALAGVAIGLRDDLPRFLPEILPPVLAAFCDPDCRVRYYACESLYNVAKVARSHTVAHFNDIFEALYKLSADTDLGVQNGFQLLDRLMKDIVAEAETFNLGAFMPLLRRRIFVANSYTRQFLIGWIAILDSVPDIDMLSHLPDFFDGLFHMLSDANKEIRQQAYAVLYDFLQESRQASALEYEPVVAILVQHCASRDRFSRLTALTWLHAFLSLGKPQLLPFCPAILGATLRSISHGEDEISDAAAQTDRALRALLQSSAGADFDVEAILATLVQHVRAEHVRTRVTAFEWIAALLRQRPAALLRHAEPLWAALLDALGDESEEVVFLNIEVIARLAAQRGYFTVALGRVMGRFAECRPLLEARAPLILRQLTSLLEPRRVYVELAALIVRQCDDLPFCTLIVQTLNAILHTSPALRALRESLRAATGGDGGGDSGDGGDGAAATAAARGGSGTRGGRAKGPPVAAVAGGAGGAGGESRAAASSGKGGADGGADGGAEGGAALFCQLYAAWCHAPVALLSLCLLAQAYEHASELICKFATAEGGEVGSVEFLVQLDRLVQLLEAPVFARLRLQLLEPERHPALVKALYGLLMLLPQSGAYQTLQQRLSAVPQLGLLRLHIGFRDKEATGTTKGGKAAGAREGEPRIDFVALQATFEAVQSRYREQGRTAQEEQWLPLDEDES
ncbi:hypothetical protein KFE25_012685 [Diacronema lutheri]|uniref:Vacuolar protein 14 C-terminal Fig4-binding domain-containing protein n=2 Tax=Diacronema lutheri TaxID=2081491 RepID=A0A8J5X5T9_DIALT|nr:hypothetical protein KFE25_012685 [Diacronema lutheri]